MAEYHVKTSENGKHQGPFSGRQLKQLARTGQLQPDHLISADGGTSWHEATKVTGLEFVAPIGEPEVLATDAARELGTGPRLRKADAEQFMTDECSVDLREFTELDDVAAESLGKCEASLSLNGLTTLSDAAAESLGKCEESLSLSTA